MSARSLADRPGRGGITINDRGDQGAIGWWPEQFDKATAFGWVGQCRQQFSDVLKIAQRHHLQNEALRVAKAVGRPAPLPEASVRQKLARAEQKQLDAAHRKIAEIADAAFMNKAKLKPFEYDKNDLVGWHARQERRAMLRQMPEKDRIAKMKSHAWRSAALETDPELSGLNPREYAELWEMELAAKFPDIVAGTAEALEAAEIVRQALKTTSEAVKSELLASGTSVAEPAEPEPPKPWA